MAIGDAERLKGIEAKVSTLAEALAQVPLRQPFFVPVLAHRWEDSEELNTTLEAAVMAEAERNGGVRRSNVGGWHSPAGRLEWAGDAGRTLIGCMLAMANHATRLVFQEHQVEGPRFGWKLSAWANLNRRGDWNNLHLHSGSTWSGTYYVSAGDTPPPDRPEAGRLTLVDPLLASQMSFFPGLLPQFLEFVPRPGLMVLFPSYLQHIVRPYLGDRPRISVAFNLSKDPYP